MKKYRLLVYVFLPLLCLPSAGAGSRPSAIGVTAAPCDSVSSGPHIEEMLLFNVSLDGGGTSGVVAPNDSFTIHFDYYVQACDPPEGEKRISVVVGIIGAPQPLSCVLQDTVDCFGSSGSVSVRMKAPAYPADYLIAFDLETTVLVPPSSAGGRAAALAVPCPTTWPHGAPSSTQYIACLAVPATNVPVPVTGGTVSVTTTGASLSGAVDPKNAPTTARFLYGTAPGVYSDSVIAPESPVSGTTQVSVSALLSGLTPNARYYYRLSAESMNGYNFGLERSFFTGALFVLPEPNHSFGYLVPNGVKTDSVTVSNDGSLTLQITSAISLGGQYTVSPASASIPAGGSRKFAVTFSPPTYGRYLSGIRFLHGGATSPDTLGLAGAVPIGSVSAGWNIVSVPLTVADPRRSVIFPAAVSPAYAFADAYVVRDTLVNGLGYWMKFPSTDSLVVGGALRENQAVSVSAGWNMIGGPSLTVPLDSIVSSPSGIISGSFFEYTTGYSAAPVLRPGKGYWVKVTQNGTLTMKGADIAMSVTVPVNLADGRRKTALTITDAAGRSAQVFLAEAGTAGLHDAELPPAPPAGAFDIRFANDLQTVPLPAAEESSVPLLIRGVRYPVTIAWDAPAAGAVLFLGGVPTPLDAPGSVTLAADQPVGIGAAGANTGSAKAPSRYGLAGNYPNPFNPSTTISFVLNAPGVIRLSVYNAIGGLVAVLADGPMPAGTHTATFDASGLPGGIYFCRLTTPQGVSTIRMLLLK